MIYLIGGSSHVGKTLLAQRLMERTGFPYMSLDHLKMGFIRSGMTELTIEDDDEICDFMWPFVVEVIKTAIENEQNMILEGCYIPVEWKESFSEEYLPHIMPLFVVIDYDHNPFTNLLQIYSISLFLTATCYFNKSCIFHLLHHYKTTSFLYTHKLLDLFIGNFFML